MEFQKGDFVKFDGTGEVHRICAYSAGSPITPPGWPVDQTGMAMNPKYCQPYKGALSAIPNDVRFGEFKPFFGKIKEYNAEEDL